MPSPTTSLDTAARDAYDVLAPAYDALTAEYPYATWLGRLVDLARAHGLQGERALDLDSADSHQLRAHRQSPCRVGQ